MKITGVKIEKLLLELTSPFRVAFGTITHSENVMIKVTTDEGVTGYGEAAPLAFVTAETTDSVLAALELFRSYEEQYGQDEKADHEIAFLVTR